MGKSQQNEQILAKTVSLYNGWVFQSDILRLDLDRRKEELGNIQVWSTATNMATLGTRKKHEARGVVSTFPNPRRCVEKCFNRENTSENETRSAHVLRTQGNQH